MRKRQSKKTEIQKVTRKIVEESSTSSSEEDEEMEMMDDSDDDVDWCPVNNNNEENDVEFTTDKISTGDFWLTKLNSKKKTHYYVAEVIGIENEDVIIKYLKKN